MLSNSFLKGKFESLSVEDMWSDISELDIPTKFVEKPSPIEVIFEEKPSVNAPSRSNQELNKLVSGLVKSIDIKKLIKKLNRDNIENIKPFQNPIATNISRITIKMASIQFI